MRACVPRNLSRRRHPTFPPASERTLPFSPPAIQTTGSRGFQPERGERFLVKSPSVLIGSILFACAGLGGCQKAQEAPVVPATAPAAAPAAAAASPLPAVQIMASIQELMDAIIDPSADALWDSVSVTTTLKGTVFHQPQTDEEWQEARRRAIALIEGTNLLVMDGRTLVAPGSPVLDQGTSGVLSAEAGQKLFEAQHPTF